MTNKQVNEYISAILDLPRTYELRYKFQVTEKDLTLDEANSLLSVVPEEERNDYCITSSRIYDYASDTTLALSAAKRIADRNNTIFVLTLDKGEWRAAYGNIWDCAEYSGANPAYVTCMSILAFMGKLK